MWTRQCAPYGAERTLLLREPSGCFSPGRAVCCDRFVVQPPSHVAMMLLPGFDWRWRLWC